jgi:transcriptional regulator with XRE-family HTH domain
MSGRRFRELRESIGYSQQRLAEEMEVTIRSISRWENGDFSIPKMAQLALKYIVEKQRGKNDRR